MINVKTEVIMAKGTCTNSTGEVILVYGDKSAQTPQDKDNALYRLPSGRKTPAGFDCDGIYVTNDRIAVQVAFPDQAGPVAVKYGLEVVDINFGLTKEGNKYKLDTPNQGVFKPSDVCCPSNFPTCVCWNIPDISHDQTVTFPEVPGHLPAIDGKWESTDADKRFLFEVTGATVKWTERGTPGTTPGQTFSRTIQLNFQSGKFRIERANDMEVLTFLAFQPQSLRDAILAKGPQPSFIVFTHQGTELLAEWNGLVVTKNPNGTLKEVIQPGVRPPKQFVFKRIP